MSPYLYDTAEPKRYRWVFWTIVLTGAATPWLTGIAIKLWLQSAGSRTWAWSFFFSPDAIGVEILMTAWVTLPFIALACYAVNVLRKSDFLGLNGEEKAIMAAVGWAGGEMATVAIFNRIFYPVFEPLEGLVIVAAAPILAALAILGSLILGMAIALLLSRIRRATTHRTGHP